MSNKLKKKKPAKNDNSHQDSVFKEAWENMNHDFARFMPGFLMKRMPKGKGSPSKQPTGNKSPRASRCRPQSGAVRHQTRH